MIAFRAHSNAIQTVAIAKQYLPVTMNVEDYDYGARYDVSQSSWTPVQSSEPCAVVNFVGQVWLPSASAPVTGLNYVCRIIKNQGLANEKTIGAHVASKGAFLNPGDWVINLAMQDVAEEGDQYRLYIFANTVPFVIDKHYLHTYWAGSKVG